MEPPTNHRVFEAINKEVGLVAILVALLSFLIVFVYYIVRTRQKKDFCKQLSDFFDDKEQSKPTKPRPTKYIEYTRYLKVSVFFLLAICLAIVVGYNVFKMGWDDPKITVEVEDNKESPYILFCPGIATDGNSLGDVSGIYYNYFKDIKPNDQDAKVLKTREFKMGEREERECKLFDGPSFDEEVQKKQIGGVYVFELRRTLRPAQPTEPTQPAPAPPSPVGIFVFIGDFKDIDRNQAFKNQIFPQGELHDSIGSQLIYGNGILTYAETKHKSLKEGKTERGFQISPIGSDSTQDSTMNIIIIAPNSVLKNVEEPPIDLAQFFSNIGGFITICSVFGFLFGGGGFVANYCFIVDKEKQDSLEEPK